MSQVLLLPDAWEECGAGHEMSFERSVMVRHHILRSTHGDREQGPSE